MSFIELKKSDPKVAFLIDSADRSPDLALGALFQNRYCWQYLAFYELEECTTAGRYVRDLVSKVPLVDGGQSIATAGNRASIALCNCARNSFGTLGESIKFKYAARAVPQYGFGVFDNFRHARS